MASVLARRKLLVAPNPLAYPAGVAPGFDRGHVAARNPLASVVAQGKNYVNLLTGQSGAPSGSTISAATLGILGPATFHGTSASEIVFTVPTTDSASVYTMAGIIQFSAITGGYQRIFKSDASSTLLVTLNASGEWEIYSFGDRTTGITAAANVPYFFAFSWDNASNWNFVIKNLKTGVIQSGTVSSPPIGGGTSLNKFIITENGSTTDAYIAAGMYSNSKLSIPQMLQWAADPWSFWYPNKTINLTSTAASVGATFLPVWAVGYNLPVLGTGTF